MQQVSDVRRPKVFISYAREDHEAALRLYRDLELMQASPWLDTESLVPGQAWSQAISRAIRETDFVIVLLSSHSVSKHGFVQKEIRLAIEALDQRPETDVFLIPARLDSSEPSHDRLRDLNWVDLFANWAVGVQRIAAAFRKAGFSIDLTAILFSHRGEILQGPVRNDEKLVVGLVTLPDALTRGTESIQQVLRSIPPVKQLSRRRLVEQLLLLDPGEYRLLVATRRPRAHSDQNRILQLFGRSVWKSNMWRIVPARDETTPSIPQDGRIPAVSSYSFSI